ncbi:DUF6452 family protein [Tenacibaculum geojense]|uniref:DUF6452 family protein n=1 Tax=Tenacibaculum geojense TaxID=915352 RepID=A0ABW3JU74_9FLAO
MKRILSAIVLVVIISFLSCEKDDFCTQNPVTPNLVIRFYDYSNTDTLKTVQRLSVIASGKTDSILTTSTTDSIAIPLNAAALETEYTLVADFTVDGVNTTRETATLKANYNTEEEFVSRSCGFKIVFNDVILEKTGWIDSLSTSQITTINNENSAHVKVFH